MPLQTSKRTARARVANSFDLNAAKAKHFGDPYASKGAYLAERRPPRPGQAAARKERLYPACALSPTRQDPRVAVARVVGVR